GLVYVSRSEEAAMTLKQLVGSALIAGALMVPSGTTAIAGQHPVTFWNNVIVSSVTIGRPGSPGLLDIALAHAAVHDAVQAIEQRYEPYLFADSSASGSPAAAVAAAAYGVLAGLYPAQRPGAVGLDQTYANFIAANGLGGDPGLGVGAQAA